MKRQIAAVLLLRECTLSIQAGHVTQTGVGSWAPVSGHIMTRWAEKVSPGERLARVPASTNVARRE